MKRYKLKIPEMIRREDAWIADALHLESMTIAESFKFDSSQGESGIKNIPPDWLEEIRCCCKCGAELDIKSGKWNYLETLTPSLEKVCLSCQSKKDEPVSAEEWDQTQVVLMKGKIEETIRLERIRAFKAGEANEQRRNQKPVPT